MRKLLVKLFKFTKNNKARRGFSLIELSVIMSTAAAATVGFLAWTQPANIVDAKKALITQQRIETISKAIEAFRIEHGRLPCPADPFMRDDNTRNTDAGVNNYRTDNATDDYPNDFGMEDLDTVQTAVRGITTLGIDCPDNIGSVPIYSLGLGKDMINDAWERKFTYQVSNTICGTDPGTGVVSTQTSQMFGCSQNDYNRGIGNITVKNAAGTTLSTKAAYVIVSYGAKSAGAYLPSGYKTANSANANEAENSNGDNTYVKDTLSSTFDDIVYFKEKLQVERLSNRKTTPQISVAECETNSQSLKTFTLTGANGITALDSNVALVAHDTDFNTGQQAALGLLKTIQSMCVSYYGTTAATIRGSTWSGPQCPGNTTGTSTYYIPTDTCTCLGGAWDGNCTMDWSVIMNIRSGLRLWLDANDTSTIYTGTDCATGAAPADASAVGCWKDKSGLAKHAVQLTSANRPLIKTNILNSKPVIRFDGSNDVLMMPRGILTDGNNPYTIFSVVKAASTAASPGWISLSGTGVASQSVAFRFNSTNTVSDLWWTNDASSSAGTTVAGTWYIIDVPYSLTADTPNGLIAGRTLYINGVSSATASAVNRSGVETADSITIGRAAKTSTEYMNGDIAEILVYNRALGTAERTSIETYLNKKWNVY